MTQINTVFSDYLDKLPLDDRKTLDSVINLVRDNHHNLEEGHSYGMPAFRYAGRPLLGFSANKKVLSLYPFDPNIIIALTPDLAGYELTKGVIKFSADKPLPDETVLAIVDMRLNYLKTGKY